MYEIQNINPPKQRASGYRHTYGNTRVFPFKKIAEIKNKNRNESFWRIE
jgi:hypothetical protein